MALGLVLTGHFSNLFVFTSLILIHEVGHFFMAVFLRYKVEKIIIYPYGGLTKIDSRFACGNIWVGCAIYIFSYYLYYV